MAIMIKDIFEDSDGTYGYRRAQAYLEKRDVRVVGATIRSIMRGLGLQAARPRAKACATVPAEDLGERPDLLGRDFTVQAQGRKSCGNITCVRTWSGFIYLATVWIAAPRRSWVVRWPTICAPPWCVKPLTWR